MEDEGLPVSLLLLVTAQLEVILAEEVVVGPLDGEAPLQQQGRELSAVLLGGWQPDSLQSYKRASHAGRALRILACIAHHGLTDEQVNAAQCCFTYKHASSTQSPVAPPCSCEQAALGPLLPRRYAGQA